MKKEDVSNACEKIYNELVENGFEVLYDDRIDVQAGFKFNEADLLGMPLQVIVGDKGLKENSVEIKIRRTGERLKVVLGELTSKIKELSNI